MEDNKIYEIIRIEGLGIKECMNRNFSTGLIFYNKEKANKKADELWRELTTEEDRNSGWCSLHFDVEERIIQ